MKLSDVPTYAAQASGDAEWYRRSRIEAALNLLAGLSGEPGDFDARIRRESHECATWWEDPLAHPIAPKRMTRDVITLDGVPVWEGWYEVYAYRIEWREQWLFEG